MRLRAAATLALLAALVAGCGGGGSSGSKSSSGGCENVKAPKPRTETRAEPRQPLDGTKTWQATLETSCGSFTIALDVKGSPHTAASFVSLARSGFYDDTVFHRTVPGFVIQGGDPTATGTGGPGYTVVDAPPGSATYLHGTVAMAKTAAEPAGTSGSQFFVVTAKNAGLPPEYALLGKVTAGLAVVDRIGKLGDANEQPTRTVVVRHVTVTSS